MIAENVKNVSASLTLAITSRAKSMKAEGVDVIGFGAGEPDFDTPAHIKDAAKQAIEQGATKYTPAAGSLALKKAVIEKMKRENDLKYDTGEVIISCGAKHALFEIIFSLLNPQDEVIIPSPYWVSYPEMVKLAGGKCIFVETVEENGFKVSAEAVKKHLSPKTKLIILNSPSNPTGTVYTADELADIGRILVDNDIYCISDEIYEKLIYDGSKHISIASLSNEVKAKTIVVNGVSKAYAMTGWRIGFGCGQNEIIAAMSKIQSHSTSNPASISQAAAVEALNGPQEAVAIMRNEFRARRDYMVDKVNDIKGLSVIKPKGAFYCFVNISQCLEKKFKGEVISDSLNFAELLLENQKVAVVPGKAFGNDSYIRLSYAIAMEKLKEGLQRTEQFISNLE